MSKLGDLQTKESIARKLQGDMAIIEKTEKEIVELNRSLASYDSSDGKMRKRICFQRMFLISLTVLMHDK